MFVFNTKKGMQKYIQFFWVYYCISFFYVEGILPNIGQNCYIRTCISYWVFQDFVSFLNSPLNDHHVIIVCVVVGESYFGLDMVYHSTYFYFLGFKGLVWVWLKEPKTMLDSGENCELLYICFFLDILKLCQSFQVMLND
jgi:hypothetical protein